MLNEKDLTLRLIIIDDSGEKAEAIITALRNGGIAVRPSRPKDVEEMTGMLSSQVDLVLIARNPLISLEQLQQRIIASGKDIPVVLLAENIDESEWVEAASHGMRAIALRNRPEHLLAVVRAEINDLLARRELRAIEARLHDSERRCDALIASSRDPIAYFHEGMHVRANDAYLEMFGYEEFEDVEGVSLLDMVAAQHVDDFKQLLKSLSKGETPPAQYQLDARNLAGETFPAMMEFATASYEGEPCIQVVFRRRDEFAPELAREVEDLRHRDLVTGLFNRPTFMSKLEDAVAQASRSQCQYGLLLIEPDHYARILSEVGLDAADAHVAMLATHLTSLLDSDIVAARSGENSFALLQEGDHQATTTLAEKIQQGFSRSILNFGERSATVTVSVGGVQIGEKNASIAQVLKRANECLHASMDMGGNVFNIFDPGAVDRAEQERTRRWLEQLRQALVGEGFVLYYQPIINLCGEPLELYQGFLRLNRNGELISPPSFISVAEEHGLITDIDRWVVAHAIAALGERRRAGHTTNMLVRIGSSSFTDPQLLALIKQQLQQHNVSGQQLWLQTPESKVFTDLRNAQKFHAAIAALGCKIGLEQFGSGLDSFQLLSHFKPDFLKLDHGLTTKVATSSESQESIRNITHRAQAAGMLTIAEFVADAGSMSSLFSAGLDYVQGSFVMSPSASMNYVF